MLSPTGSVWSWFRWWPISSAEQARFAEALSQALAAGIELSEAIRVAASTKLSKRFRQALEEMALLCRSGYSLEVSLSRTGVRVKEGLLAVLQVGEDQGNLLAELSAFAHRTDPRVSAQLRRAVGRSPQVVRFAAALARLLSDRRLTLALVEDAGRLAADGNEAFRTVMQQIVEAMRNGELFAAALARHPRWFDNLFSRMVEAATTREIMRSTLARLAGEQVDAYEGTHVRG